MADGSGSCSCSLMGHQKLSLYHFQLPTRHLLPKLVWWTFVNNQLAVRGLVWWEYWSRHNNIKPDNSLQYKVPVKVSFIASLAKNKIFNEQAWFWYNKCMSKKKWSVSKLVKLSIHHNNNTGEKYSFLVHAQWNKIDQTEYSDYCKHSKQKPMVFMGSLSFMLNQRCI